MTNKANTQTLIREMQENVAKYGRENTTTYLMVQAINALQQQDRELEAVGAGGMQALSAVDIDGEAFRTAARLGLTLRFYGACAQSSMPGTPSAYVVTHHGDRAEAMREAVKQAANIIARGGEAPPATLASPAQPAAPQAARCTHEQQLAIRQGHEIAASEGYFAARSDIDSIGRRKTFEAGFLRGWDAALREQGGST